jgi:DNA-binding MarR family transcriptional regulator
MAGVLREHGATLAQYAVVTALDEEPGLSNAGLARRAFVTPQTMNQVLRELEEKGWVARHPDPAHARILQADLTPAGRTALRACRLAVDAVEKQMLAEELPEPVAIAAWELIQREDGNRPKHQTEGSGRP